MTMTETKTPHVHGAAGRGRVASPAMTEGVRRPLRVGIGGPVGSGKTALVAALCRALADQLALAVVTNDIYTTEDAEFLRRAGVLAEERISAVRTGCCPHTAIRDDITANLDAVEDLEARFAPLDLILVESGGDNLTATFSKGLVDHQIFVVDVAGGDKVPRKGGPGVTGADLLVINKIDLAEMVGADLSVMDRDSKAVRGDAPVIFSSLRQAASGPRRVGVGAEPGRRLDAGRVKARARVVAGPGGPYTAAVLRSDLPIVLRPADDAVYIAQGAAGPLGGDDIELSIEVPDGCSLRLRAVASTLVLPSVTGGVAHDHGTGDGRRGCVARAAPRAGGGRRQRLRRAASRRSSSQRTPGCCGARRSCSAGTASRAAR